MFGNLGDMMGKLQEAQDRTEEIRKKLDTVYVNGESGGVKVTVTANNAVKDIEIADTLLEDKEELADHMILALNKALENAKEVHDREMQSVASGMMPGLGDMFK